MRGWVGWPGGTSPAKEFQTGMVRHRNGLQVPHIDLSACDWQHKGNADDIVAYKFGDVLLESPDRIDNSAAPELYSALLLALDYISGLTGEPNIIGPISRALEKAKIQEC